MSKSKNIGTRAETAVVRYLQANGFPTAERRALRGTHDAGDITGTPGIAWEVKGGDAAHRAGDKQVTEWLLDTALEKTHAGADLGVLVLRRAGYSADRAGSWWAILNVHDFAWLYRSAGAPPVPDLIPVRITLAHAVLLLRAAGYGDALQDEAA